jgi:diaminopimelate epimerase
MRRTATISFEKYEGLGNDFVVVRARSADEVGTDWAHAVCDRRRGIGADGVLVILPPGSAGAAARMRVINADGSIAEMCGNGLRCAALHLAIGAELERGEIGIDTDAGLRRCAIERHGDEAVVVADMGVVLLQSEIAVAVAGESVALTRVDAGNPHAVALRSVSRAEFERLGPALSIAPAFEHGVNVEFASVDGAVLDVVVWERGAGATLACGTGACAAVAVARANGVVPSSGPVRVRLPGGELEVTYDRVSGATTLRGPARRVFAGRLTGGAA